MDLLGSSNATCPYGRMIAVHRTHGLYSMSLRAHDESLSYGRLTKSNSHLYVVSATNCNFNIIAELTGDNRIQYTAVRNSKLADQGTIELLS